jgi:hypothetical protein
MLSSTPVASATMMNVHRMSAFCTTKALRHVWQEFSEACAAK